TGFGGSNGNGGTGWGTVYKLAPDGTETVLYAFQGGNDGWVPIGGTLRDKSGNLYGTTAFGGGTGCDGGSGCGTVFKVAPDGTEIILHSFQGDGIDGFYPWAGVVADRSGILYGTTERTVYKLAPDGTLTTLHAFTFGSDGGETVAPLILDRGGDLYGTTMTGGDTRLCGGAGCGVVFKIAPDGAETVLHTFIGGSDGISPDDGLARDKAGNLYGTTSSGGTLGFGVVFKLAPDGTEMILHSFGGTLDGEDPEAGLVLDAAGNLYGTTPFGGIDCGQFQCGIVFKLAPDGTERVLHRFKAGDDGCGPGSADALILLKDQLYGTTSGCGAHGDGTVFRIRK
ncbi:MAG TPA: choice-of-anchor tandem repeat GloVer-containing protein, partial [Rhizomicrobium sp.]|nr:choice-of-anchor tandem repeat GloVer-containing protein [Rhizomicrobium sp.]